MPLFEYECSDCHAHKDEFRTVAERNNPPACECGAMMKKIISGYRVVGDLEPYYDDNLEAFVKSKQHRREVMREKGVSEKFGTNWMTAASSKRHARK
jgi:putative FmdB family regulatory protein